MSITVKYFASVRERVGRAEDSLEFGVPMTVAEVWSQAAGLPAPPNLLAAVNHQHVRLDQAVRDGDEVAFFPPVTGGGQ